jgi:hypothetical protein
LNVGSMVGLFPAWAMTLMGLGNALGAATMFHHWVRALKESRHQQQRREGAVGCPRDASEVN